MPLRGRDQPTEREMMEYRQELQQEQQETQTATQLASQAATDRGVAEPGYWDVIGDPDIGREIDEGREHIEEFLATELSDKFALGNITYQDWKSWTWQIENEFWTMRNELQDADSNLDDLDMLAMYGETRPTHTNERERRLRSASQVKKMMVSNSVDARGLRSGTEIHAVARTENEGPEEEEQGGRLRSMRNWLSG